MNPLQEANDMLSREEKRAFHALARESVGLPSLPPLQEECRPAEGVLGIDRVASQLAFILQATGQFPHPPVKRSLAVGLVGRVSPSTADSRAGG